MTGVTGGARRGAGCGVGREEPEELAALVADVGTDPEVLAGLVAWASAPRCWPDALRRRERDDGGPAADAETGHRLLAQARGRGSGQRRWAASRLLARWAELDCRVAVVGSAGYPLRLARGWPDVAAPVLLVRRGEGPAGDPAPTLAVVGARRATAYGTGIAAWLAEEAARAGVRVVSGGAIGVDAAAHRAVTAAGRPGDVVLGCGHGVAYPREHARPGGLFDGVLAAGGALISELLPDVPPRPAVVKARNRVLAGLADAVVVVEGSDRSGALVTASAAAELDRPVLAVPGDVRAPGSVAPNRLLQEGAIPCTGPQDLLAAVGAVGGTRPAPGADDAADTAGSLPGPVHACLAATWPRAVPVDVLAGEADLALGGLLAALTRAEVAGQVVMDASGVRLRRAPSDRNGPGRAARR